MFTRAETSRHATPHDFALALPVQVPAQEPKAGRTLLQTPQTAEVERGQRGISSPREIETAQRQLGRSTTVVGLLIMLLAATATLISGCTSDGPGTRAGPNAGPAITETDEVGKREIDVDRRETEVGKREIDVDRRETESGS